jgi:Zn-dependent protease with chaperone function
MNRPLGGPELAPLAYHRNVSAYLRTAEPEVWEWAISNSAQAQHLQDTRAAMLRHTYRLEPEVHPEVHEACGKAMAALGIAAPLTLYQAADGSMNAALCYIPGEIHLIFDGPILERLSPEERLALMGHELAHYRLWSQDTGAFYAASRILDHAVTYPSPPSAHLETARLFSLHTELYADRGGALAAGGAEARSQRWSRS